MTIQRERINWMITGKLTVGNVEILPDQIGVLNAITASAAELNVTDGLTASTAELNIMDGVTATTSEINALDGMPVAAAFTIGDETTNAIAVTVQLRDGNAASIATRRGVFAYLATDSTGDTIAPTAPSGGVAVGASGIVIPVVAGKAFQLISEANGQIALTITEVGAATWYFVLVMPDGRLVASGAITFVA